MMTGRVPVLKYIGHKAKSIKWQPLENNILSSSTIFATGSYDDKVNKVCLWKYASESTENTDGIIQPDQIHQLSTCSDVTDMMFIKNNVLLVTLANGSVVVMTLNYEILEQVHVWKKIHHYCNGSPAACNVVSQHSHSSPFVITGGDDGRLIVVAAETNDILEVIETKDSTPITSLINYHHSELLAGNFSGQLMLWDIRSKPSIPLRTFPISGELVFAECLASHPNQPHTVAAGCSNGLISILDLRQEKMPVSLIQAHTHEIWEAQFHSQFPDNLITCSQDGSLLHWTHKDRSRSTVDCMWLTAKIPAGQIDITNLVPTTNKASVNSFDVSSNCLIAVTDSEALYVLPGIDFQ